MTKAETRQMMDTIAAVHSRFRTNGPALAVWSSLFKNVDREDASMALQKHLKGSPFPPKPADLLALIPKKDAGEESDGLPRLTDCDRCRGYGLVVVERFDSRTQGKYWEFRSCTCEAGQVQDPKVFPPIDYEKYTEIGRLGLRIYGPNTGTPKAELNGPEGQNGAEND